MSTLFKGVYYYVAIPLIEHTIQGSTLIKGAYYLRKYGKNIFIVYVDIGTEASGTATLAFAFDGDSTNRKYDIKVAQIPCGAKYA